MLALLLLVVLPQSPPQVATTASPEPIRLRPLDQVASLSIVTARSSYYLYEPIYATIQLENLTEDPIKVGFLTFGSASGQIQVGWRAQGGIFGAGTGGVGCIEPFECRPGGPAACPEVNASPSTVEPYEVWSRTVLLKQSLGGSEPMLSGILKPGEYSVMVTYVRPGTPEEYVHRPVLQRLVARTSVEIEEPPESEQEAALAFQDKKIVALMGAGGPWSSHDLIRDGISLLQRYPSSLYAGGLRRALLSQISWLRRHGDAQPEELSFLSTLKRIREVTGRDNFATHDCDGGIATVDGDSNSVHLVHCQRVEVRGNHNFVDAGAPQTLLIFGNENDVLWDSAAGGTVVTEKGRLNQLIRARP